MSVWADRPQRKYAGDTADLAPKPLRDAGLARPWAGGYYCGKRGYKLSENPYEDVRAAEAWRRGFVDGKAEGAAEALEGTL